MLKQFSIVPTKTCGSMFQGAYQLAETFLFNQENILPQIEEKVQPELYQTKVQHIWNHRLH